MTKATWIVNGIGPVDYQLSHDFTTGTSRYQLAGYRFRGVLIVTPWFGLHPYAWNASSPLRLDTDHLAVILGDGPAERPNLPVASEVYRHRPDRPVLNGVQLTGATIVSINDAMSCGTGPVPRHLLKLELGREREPHGIHRVPRATADRMAAIIAATARSWRNLHVDVGDRLRAAAARHLTAQWLELVSDELADLSTARRALAAREDRLDRSYKTFAPLLRELLQKPSAASNAT
ncbi:hypothetical protein AB0M46_13555 [Dactylosporangium sp. NPDC051485]|uniref:hypothetical protein n=1 Tax=Dactylosporangium sp. NPDC051485 TaxID=3154846 RepID=UPI00343DEF3E